jgi:hypothetical protein
MWTSTAAMQGSKAVRIEMRVTDGSGNTNICWLEILVEDKIRPFCYAPHNTSGLHELPYDFSPTNLYNCALLATAPTRRATTASLQRMTELAPIVNLHDCGWGTIIRRFQAVDQAGNISANQCQQVITINEVHNYEIRFPRDYSANCGVATPDTITVHRNRLRSVGSECI